MTERAINLRTHERVKCKPTLNQKVVARMGQRKGVQGFGGETEGKETTWETQA
jgi:hypothetical protein